jgi:Plasmid pRiA4b ORF-3-like protein
MRTAQVYQFTLALVGAEPPVWRRIQIPESYSFWDLHVALQDSMGWRDYHLHVFRVARPGTGDVEQIGIPDDDPFEGEKPTLPGWEIPITRYFPRPGTIVQYEYDFGDGWEHELTLEAILPRQAGKKYPLCIDGARACPPEDCGGIHGYENLLAVIQDPTHEEHESILEWLGGRFDPDTFDPKRVKFDNPARRYQLAFEEPVGGRRTTKLDRTRRIDEIAARALELDRRGRIRLARRLLESLETLSDVENERLRAEEVERRDARRDPTPPHPNDR